MAGALYDFDPESLPFPPGMRPLGGGGAGGKARGLWFAARRLAPTAAGIPIRIPRSVIVRSDVFEEFVGDNDLRRHVGQMPFADLAARFAAASFRPARRAEFAQLLRRMRTPLAVRSSSRLEDGTQHAFAGIYRTDFIANRGTAADRLAAFEAALRRVFASTYNDHAIAYRAKRGLDDAGECMSVVVQRMIGRRRAHLVYPAIAGVAFSRNFYPWAPVIRREEGLARVVFGLGTRAVGRNYARVVSLSHPLLRPEGHVVSDIERYSQEVFDALDVQADRLESLHVSAVAALDPDLARLCSVARGGDYLLHDTALAEPGDRRVLTFERLLRPGGPLPLVALLRELLAALESTCGLPVDVEFAVTLPPPGTAARPRFWLLQLRPLGVRAPHQRIAWPEVAADCILIEAARSMGNVRLQDLKHIVYVSPRAYLREPASATVSAIAALNRGLEGEGYLLIGPGRWGTRNEQLGVPVLYGHICHARALIEVSAASFAPELSFGTHFFGDLFGEDIPYVAVFPERGDRLQTQWLETAPARFESAGVRWIVIDSGAGLVVDGATSRARVFLQPARSV
jgi:hypothetical protein